MHATTGELIACRDGEPLDAQVALHIRECGDCSRALQQLIDLRAGLRELPEEQAPAGSWEAIEARWELERHPGNSMLRPLAVAASLLAAIVVSLLLWPTARQELPVVAGSGQPGAAMSGQASLAALQGRSQYLEEMLAAVERNSGSVTSLRTAGTAVELEDSIALIDYRLANSDPASLSEADRRELWQQRVELMESLVTLRYAQARANSI